MHYSYYIGFRKKKIREFQDDILHEMLEYCNIQTVSTKLKTKKAISSDQLEQINKANSRSEANRKFFEILDGDPSQRKLETLAEVLFTDETHDGHQELSREIKQLFTGTKCL